MANPDTAPLGDLIEIGESSVLEIANATVTLTVYLTEHPKGQFQQVVPSVGEGLRLAAQISRDGFVYSTPDGYVFTPGHNILRAEVRETG